MSEILELWVDGASNVHNEKLPGGWSSVYVYNKMLIDTKYGGVAPTTSQRMELTGVLEGLKGIASNEKVTCLKFNTINIYSDSAYVIEGMTKKWYLLWRYNGWKNADQQDVKNKDIWQELSALVEDIEITRGIKINWCKVKGHIGITYNEIADKLAVKGKKSVS
jgi:ribonuclease HI